MQTRSRTSEAKRRRMFENKRLPDEMITELLLRVPVKSLVRFKIACKLWHSLISDPNFTKSHFDLAAAPAERFLLINTFNQELLSIDFNASLLDDSAAVPLTPPRFYSVPAFSERFKILGSCRGFLFMEFLKRFWVWNPITRVNVKIPFSHMSLSNSVFAVGFGYNPSTDDYLVVQVLYPDFKKDNSVELFSLKADKWVEIKDPGLPFKRMGPLGDDGDSHAGPGSLLNNVIHWLAYIPGWPGCAEERIIPVIFTFDLTERIFSKLPLPIDYKYVRGQINGLKVLGDSLCLCSVLRGSLQLWVMEEYKVQSSWTKTARVSLNDVPGTIPIHGMSAGPVRYPRNYEKFLEVVCSTKSGGIVLRDDGMGLVKFNDNGGLHEHQSYEDYFKYNALEVARYTQSLLSLPLVKRKT